MASSTHVLACFGALCLLLSVTSAATILVEPDFSSQMNLTWPGVNYSDQMVIRIPTGTGSLWRLNVTTTVRSSFYFYLSKGFPYQYTLSTYPSYQLLLARNSTTTFELYDDPQSPSNHYLMYTYFSGYAYLNLSLVESSFTYAPLMTSDFRVFNFSVTVPQLGSVSYDVTRRVATSPSASTMMFFILSPTVIFPSMSIARGYGALQENPGGTLLPGVEYRHLFSAFLSAGVYNYSMAASVAPAPNTIENGVPSQFTLKAFRHRNFYLRMHPLTGILAGNHTITFTLNGATLTDLLQVTGAQGSATFGLSACVTDTNRVSYISVAYSPRPFTVAEVEAETREISFGITLQSNVFEPPALMPNENVFVPSGKTVVYRVSGLAAAVSSAGFIAINKNASVTSYFGKTGGLSILPTGVACAVGAVATSARVQKIEACSYASGGAFDTSIMISGPVSFNYTIESALMVTQAPASLSYTGSLTFVGPSDPTPYPLVIRTKATIFDLDDLDIYSSFYKSGSCGVANSFLQCNLRWYDDQRDCDSLLLCPGQSIRLIMDRSSANEVTNVTSITSMTKYSVTLDGSASSSQYTVSAQSRVALSVTVPAGVRYTATIVSITGTIPSDAIMEFYGGGCDGSTPSRVAQTTINSTAVRITVDKPGFLILKASQFQATYTVSFSVVNPPAPVATPVQCSSSTNFNIPAICSSRVSGMVYTPSFVSSYITNYVVPLNATYATLYPDDFAASGTCYNAFITEACRANIPLCDAQSKQEVGTLCPDACTARMTAAGCTNPSILSLCQLQRASCPPLPSPPAVTAAPYFPYTGSPFVAPPNAVVNPTPQPAGSTPSAAGTAPSSVTPTPSPTRTPSPTPSPEGSAPATGQISGCEAQLSLVSLTLTALAVVMVSMF